MQKQQQMEEMKKRQEENKRKLEEARKKQQEEAQKKIAEMQRLREEAVKKKQEEEKRLREEIEKKKAAEEQKRVESRSTFAIRRIVQKIRICTPETFESLKTELDAEMEKELEKCGTQKEKMQEEVEKGLEAAQKRIDLIAEERKKAEEKKAEDERIRKEKAEKAKSCCEQLTALVDAAEAEHGNLKEFVKELEFEDSAKVTPAEIDKIYAKVTSGEEACKTAAEACMGFIKQESPAMKDPAADAETKTACAKLLAKIQEVQKATENTMVSAKGTKAKAYKKAAAQEKTRAMEALFTKYDKDKDKAWSQKEVTAYAKEKLGVSSIEKDTMTWIWRALVEEGSKGVTVDKLPKLHAIIGVQREHIRDKKRKEERIEKEAVIGGMRDALKAKVTASTKFVTAAEKAVGELEEEMGNWCKKAKVMTPEDMISQTDECEKRIQAAAAAFDKAKAEMDKMKAGIEPKYEKDLKAYLAEQSKKIEMTMGRMDGRVNRVKNISRRFRNQAKNKEGEEMESLRSKVLKVLWHNQAIKELTSEDLFELLADGKSEVDESAWLRFFETADLEVKPLNVSLKGLTVAKPKEPEKEPEAEKADEAEKAKEGEEKTEETEKKEGDAEAETEKKDDAEEKTEEKKEEEAPKEEPKKKEEEAVPGEKVELSEDELKRVFEFIDEDGTGTLSKEIFIQMGKRHMKVVKETAMTSAMGIAGGKALRKLEPKEVVHVLKGPVKDDSMKVSRIFAKALKDGLEGWVSVAGNQGTVFLADSSASYKVIRKCSLTDSFETSAEAKAEDGLQLLPGMVLEVHEAPRKDEESGLTRMKGRVKGLPAKGGVGYATTSDKKGKVFLKMY